MLKERSMQLECDMVERQWWSGAWQIARDVTVIVFIEQHNPVRRKVRSTVHTNAGIDTTDNRRRRGRTTAASNREPVAANNADISVQRDEHRRGEHGSGLRAVPLPHQRPQGAARRQVLPEARLRRLEHRRLYHAHTAASARRRCERVLCEPVAQRVRH